MIEFILLIVFLMLLFYYVFFLIDIGRGLENLSSNYYDNNYEPTITIVIPFRNEEAMILDNLKSIEAQNYPAHKLEIIYVDDDSTDESYSLLEQYPTKLKVRIIKVPKGFSPQAHKKRAIRFGIEHAEGEVIVGTDADCVYKENWLYTLMSTFDLNTGFVSAPVKFNNGVNLFERIQQLEFGGLVLTGAGLIGVNKPTICNAANIAYKRSVYDEVGGFSDNMNLSSGDDEFLMQKIASDTEWKIKFCFSVDAVVSTNPNKTVKQFYHQRKRWASKGLFYSSKTLILKLIAIFLFFLGMMMQLVLGIFLYPVFLISFLFSFFIKMFFELRLLRYGEGLVFGRIKYFDFVIAELLHIIYIVIAAFAGSMGNLTWKERKVKR